MIDSIKFALLNNWHFARILRLILGLMFLAQTVYQPEVFSVFVSLFLLFQAFTNTGCCSNGACSVEIGSKDKGQDGEIVYDEVKSDTKIK